MKKLTEAIINKILEKGIMGDSSKIEAEIPTELGTIKIVAHNVHISLITAEEVE